MNWHFSRTLHSKLNWLGWLFITCLLANSGPNTPVHAQQYPQYVVQSGDSLYTIALTFGTTIDKLRDANGMTEADPLSIGRRLFIPSYADLDGGLLRLYPVQPGDTLDSIAYKMQLPRTELARLNHLLNPSSLYIGQNFIYRVALTDQNLSDSPTWQGTGRLLRVPTGQSFLQLAAQKRLNIVEVARLNKLSPLHPLALPGQTLITPDIMPFSTLTDPILSLTFNPPRLLQGQLLEIHARLQPGATVQGTLNARPLHFIPYGGEFLALQGIYAFAEPGIYPFDLQIQLPDGSQTAYHANVRIVEIDYGSQAIEVGGYIAQVLNDQVTVPAESKRIRELISLFSPQRAWQGQFVAPIPIDRITTRFGVKRSYNAGPYDSFHDGIDFPAPPTTQILAPAAGRVVLAERLTVRGNAVIIDHGWGVYSGYWHMTEITVQTGQSVVAGQLLGLVGTTGLSTGNHLHWVIWVNGNQIDPLLWLDRNYK
jgi:murein DD-endopeptidase MepM/ murein hydrolase activator NlpD